MSHLVDNNFRRNFKKWINPICNCGQEIETSTHFLPNYPNYHCARHTFFEKVKNIDSATLRQRKQVVTKLLNALQKSQDWRPQLGLCKLLRDLKPHYLIKYLSGMLPLTRDYHVLFFKKWYSMWTYNFQRIAKQKKQQLDRSKIITNIMSKNKKYLNILGESVSPMT